MKKRKIVLLIAAVPFFIIGLCSIIQAEEKIQHQAIYYFSFDDKTIKNGGTSEVTAVEIPETVSFAKGKKGLGEAIVFSGTPLNIPWKEADLFKKNQRYTIAFWVRPENTWKGMVLEQNGGTGINLDWYAGCLRMRADRIVNKHVRGAMGANSWIHLAVTYDREKGGACYLNGMKLYEYKGGGSGWFNKGPIKLGGFKGKLDEFYLFPEVLTQDEILSIAGISPPKPDGPDPKVSLTGLKQGQEFKPDTPITLTADVKAVDGSPVERVAFYSGTLWLGESTKPPYTMLWKKPLPGTHYIRAKAWTKAKGVGFSEPTRIYIPGGTKGSPAPVAVAGSNRMEWLGDGKQGREKDSVSLKLEGKVFAEVPMKDISTSWKQTAGPAKVVISNPSVLDPEVTFTKPGIYTLTLEAKHGSQKSTSPVSIRIYPPSQTFGYSLEHCKRNFTFDLGFNYLFDGLAFSRFKAPPKPGIHPRIFLNPEDVPDLRERLKNTRVGKYVMGRIRSRNIKQLYTNPAYITPDKKSDDIQKKLMNSSFKALMAYDALRVLVDDDKEGGAKLAQAFTASCRQTYTEIQKVMPTTNYREKIQGIIGRQFMGITYDLLYNYMTKKQQDTCRKTLALASNKMWSIGMDAPPGAVGSNWVPTHIMHLMFNHLAIEGEEGSDPELYSRLVAGYERFMHDGVFTDGFTSEGLGKNTFIAELLIPLAKRGNWLIATLQARRHMEKHYAYTMVPWGKSNFVRHRQDICNVFTWDETLGGCYAQSRYADVPVFKYAYPTNPVIDSVNRFELGENCERLHDFNIRFPYKAMDYMTRAICAENWDDSLSHEEALQQIADQPLSYFAEIRGRLITRSDRTPDALQLQFQPRHLSGGHIQKDRNKIIFAALGRIWLSDAGPHGGMSKAHSVVTVDGKDIGYSSSTTLAYKDEPMATFAAADASTSYSGLVDSEDEIEFVPRANNTLRQKRFPRYFDISSAFFPNWNSGKKIVRSLTAKRILPTTAVRTTGIVRGKSPYALVIDNIQMSEKVRDYNWGIYLGRGLKDGISFNGVPINADSEWKVEDGKADASGNYDLILHDKERKVNLLLRFLHADGIHSVKQGTYNNLTVNAKSVSPQFVVLLYPFRDGEELPKTTFGGMNGTTTISIGDQQDHLKLKTPKGSQSNLIIERNGKKLIEL